VSRSYARLKRVVVKIGTNLLSKGSSIDEAYVHDMARQLAGEIKAGRQILLVTSGAIGMGAGELGLGAKPKEIGMRQACAAIGQPLLMQRYREAFKAHGVTVAQVLLTADLLSRRESYLNLRASVEELLKLGAIPIFNENDVVSTAEIGNAFGDNDRLSAYVASKVDADLLVILTDIDAMYDADPRANPGAKPLSTVARIDAGILAAAGAAGSAFSTGGMRTKVEAARIAIKAGCPMLLAHGRLPDVLPRALSGEEFGTLFLATSKLPSRKRWILNSSPAGRITVDEGALAALRARKSLLPSGVRSVEGVFSSGDVIMVNGALKLVTRLDSTELRLAMGKHSEKGEGGGTKLVARPEDMAFLDE
jgi:glutamate 5-kinase